MTRALNREALLEEMARIARAAGEVVMAVYAQDFAVRNKDDASPVTLADERAEALITMHLRALLPGVPVVAEEAVAAGDEPEPGALFWLVDPLDGTREFVSRNGEFTVNIALVEQGRPVLGVVFAPALDALYGGGPGLGSWVERQGRRQSIACRVPPAEGCTLVASRSHGDEEALQGFLHAQSSGLTVATRRNIGSSLKLGLIAEGEADLYPRLGRTMEWDIAAGHAVLLGAGGVVLDLNGEALRYGKPGFENPHFLARARAPMA